MLWFAHRGVSERFPENTLEAIAAAIEDDVDGVEFDVHFSKDGVGVIIHDETVNRTTNGKGRVVDMTVAELQALDAGARFKGEAIKTKIPTLDEVLTILAPATLRLNVELKTDTIRYDGLEAYVLERCAAHGITSDRLLFSSFNHYSVALIRKLDPSVETAILYPYPIYHPEEQALRIGATGIHPDYRRVTEADVAFAHAQDVTVRVYTPKTVDDVRQMQAIGVDAVIVNDPKGMRDRLKG